MIQTKYIVERDELNIEFKEYDVPQCIKLDSGIILEFDNEENLVNIVLPNFYQMIHKQPMPGIDVEYSHSFFENQVLTLVLKLEQQSINVKIDLKAIDK